MKKQSCAQLTKEFRICFIQLRLKWFWHVVSNHDLDAAPPQKNVQVEISLSIEKVLLVLARWANLDQFMLL